MNAKLPSTNFSSGASPIPISGRTSGLRGLSGSTSKRPSDQSPGLLVNPSEVHVGTRNCNVLGVEGRRACL